jgi:hypothetical protein
MTARSRIRTQARLFTVSLSFAVLLIATAAKSTPAQTVPVERSYAHPLDEVQRALQVLDVDATSRLPFLDGFVSASANSLDHLENPRYILRCDVVRLGPTESIVRISAKITAWYVSADASHSEYRAIPSNGRLESDFLDRLSARLDPAPNAHPETYAEAPAAANPPAQTGPATPTNTSATRAAGVKPSDNGADLAAQSQRSHGS